MAMGMTFFVGKIEEFPVLALVFSPWGAQATTLFASLLIFAAKRGANNQIT